MLVILFSEYEGQLQTRQNERVRIFYINTLSRLTIYIDTPKQNI